VISDKADASAAGVGLCARVAEDANSTAAANDMRFKQATFIKVISSDGFWPFNKAQQRG
jgi:hypothetical protein